MRKIYAIEFYERDGEGENTIFTKVLPNVPIDKDVFTRKALVKHIEESDMNDIDKLCALNGIGFACDMWFPKNFFRITMVDWKG